MPATKYRERNTNYDAYYSKAYTERKQYMNMNVSTAYEIPPTYPKREVERQAERTNAKKSKAKSSVDTRRVRICFAVATFVFLCFTLIYRQTVILESNQELKKLETQYAELLASNQAMQSKIDMSLEMGEVEKFAREKLGMMKPESGQMFYVDMQMEDVGGKGSVSESGMTAISGIQGTLVNAFRVLN